MAFKYEHRQVTPDLKLWLRLGESLDYTVVEEVIDRDSYRVKDLDLDGAVVVDCGAHIGVFSCLCAAQGAKAVYAIEPQPQNRESLYRNAEGWPAITVVPYALGATEEMTRIVWVSGGAHVVPLGQPNAMGPVWEVQQVTLRWVFTTYGIGHVDLLKLDMEGAEVDTLLACPPEMFASINRIVAETHGASTTHTWYRDPQKLIDYLTQFYAVELVGSPAGLAKLYATRKT